MHGSCARAITINKAIESMNQLVLSLIHPQTACTDAYVNLYVSVSSPACSTREYVFVCV
jgi:hypothetical protein